MMRSVKASDEGEDGLPSGARDRDDRELGASLAFPPNITIEFLAKARETTRKQAARNAQDYLRQTSGAVWPSGTAAARASGGQAAATGSSNTSTTMLPRWIMPLR
jgi:hypothetical protein